MISVVCCYNRKSEFENLKESLHKQNCSFEVVAVDNTEHEFSSAAAALNHGAAIAKGEWLVFLHQDIVFMSERSLNEFVKPLKLEEQCADIVGIHGAAHGQRCCLANYQTVDTLDECCVAMRKDMWEKYPFNETLCDGWHLYVVELCLRMKADGKRIVTGVFDIQHLSSGNVDDAYMKTYRHLMRQYKHEKWIATTCKSLPNNMVIYWIYWLAWKIKKKLFGNYHLLHRIKMLLRSQK